MKCAHAAWSPALFATTAIAAAGITLAGCGRGAPAGMDESSLLHQRAVNRAFTELEASARKDFAAKSGRSGDGRSLHAVRMQENIQRVVERELKPVPVTKDGLKPVLPQRRMKWATLTDDETRQLTVAARSVGRLEGPGPDGPRTLYGTGFVVGERFAVVTNCHVIESMTEGRADARRLKGRTGGWMVDFGYTPEHDPASEFAITGVGGYSLVAGLDVAVLTVNGRSVDDTATLPAPLPVASERVSRVWGTEDLRAGVIGYPAIQSSGHEATDEMLRSLLHAAPGTIAKIYSPGGVTNVHDVDGVAFLFHVVSTFPGESGSPIIDLSNFTVVGVHACCRSDDAVVVMDDRLPCASTIAANPRSNEAVGAWQAFADPTLSHWFARRTGTGTLLEGRR